MVEIFEDEKGEYIIHPCDYCHKDFKAYRIHGSILWKGACPKCAKEKPWFKADRRKK